MRTDLIGGGDIAAKIAALQEQLEDAQRTRDDAAEALKASKQADIAVGAEALRTGSTPPDPSEPAAQAALDDAERHLDIVTLALREECKAQQEDIAMRADAITADLAAREDAGDARIAALLDEVDELLIEKSAIRAHRDFVRGGAVGVVGRRKRVGEVELRTLHAAVAQGDGETQRDAWLRNYDAWKALVERAHATVPARARVGLALDQLTGLLDGAVEAEVARLSEAGEDVPTPTTVKWGQRLGIGKWAGLPKSELTPMPPDEDSAESRHRDLVRA